MKKRILICDDDIDIREVTSLILKSHGYEVKVLDNGHNILAEIVGFHPDILLLDVMMPEEDGREIAKTLKNDRRTAELPVLLFTAVNNAHSHTLEAGADGVVSKPFEIKDLIHTIESFLHPEAHSSLSPVAQSV